MGLRDGGGWTQEEFWLVLRDVWAAQYKALVRLAGIYLDSAGEDAVQDAFVQVSLQWERIGDEDKVLLYLRRAVMNKAKSELRHRRVVDRPRRVLPARAPTSEDLALHNLADEAMVLRLRGLPPRQAACVGLRFGLDLSEKETAEILGIGTGSVKKHTSRAVHKLAALTEKIHD